MNPIQEDSDSQPSPQRRIKLEHVAVFGGLVINGALIGMWLLPSATLAMVALIVLTIVILLIAIAFSQIEQVLGGLFGARFRLASGVAQGNIYIVEGTPHYRLLREKGEDGRDIIHYYVEVEGHRFEMLRDFWEMMARRDGDVRLRYLKASDDLPDTLVSIQPLDANTPPSEYRLQHVVGVGDDGELVYSEDLYDDLPDGEIVEIRRKPLG
jgi:hypothetical protein